MVSIYFLSLQCVPFKITKPFLWWQSFICIPLVKQHGHFGSPLALNYLLAEIYCQG